MTEQQIAIAEALERAFEEPGERVPVEGLGFHVWRAGEVLETDLVVPTVVRAGAGAVYRNRRLGGFDSLRQAAAAIERALRGQERLLADLRLGQLELACARVA